MALRARKVSGAFEKRAPGHDLPTCRDESVAIFSSTQYCGTGLLIPYNVTKIQTSELLILVPRIQTGLNSWD